MLRSVHVTVNGRRHEHEVEPRLLLVHYLRDVLGLIGTRAGCDTSNCGTCTVLVDGEAVKACNVFSVQVDGCEVTTIEGLNEVAGNRLQERLASLLECGACEPGFTITALALLDGEHMPDEAQIRRHLEGNICRCVGYGGIVTAIQDVAASAGEVLT